MIPKLNFCKNLVLALGAGYTPSALYDLGLRHKKLGKFEILPTARISFFRSGDLYTNLVSDLNIYPNPSSNIFNLEFNIDAEAEILVTNVLGEQVHFESIQSIGKYNTQIDLSNYSKGVYNLTIKTYDGISNHKLILQ